MVATSTMARELVREYNEAMDEIRVLRRQLDREREAHEAATAAWGALYLELERENRRLRKLVPTPTYPAAMSV